MPRLTNETVANIKAELAEGVKTKAQIARENNTTRSAVWHISVGGHKNVIPAKATRPVTRVTEQKHGNVLVIGDLHHPFCLEGYLSFCLEQKERFDCKQVVFIGDVIDNHYPSYHETDPDGMSGGFELDLAIEKTKPWVEVFPEAYICIGNHDRLVMRKAFSGGIPRAWIRDYCDVLEAPGWQFVDEVVIDDVQYIHGEGGTARTKAKNDKFSTVQGHLHTQAYVESMVGRTTCVFAMQVGCGVDRKAYAMAYAKTGPKPAIGCGVVLDQGSLAVQIMADLTEERFSV